MSDSRRCVDGDADVIGLRDVHRDVGLLEQRLGRQPVLGVARDAEARADAERVLLDHARLLDGVQHFLRGQHRAVDVGQRQDDRELVAAEARHGVGIAQHAADAPGHPLQDAIAGVMAQRVVDLLEAVQVEQQQRDGCSLAVGDPRRLLEAIVQERPVRQLGQRVVIRQVRQALLDAPALAPHARLAELALHGRKQPLQVVLHDVVVGAGAHRRDGGIFAHRPRHENEGHIGVAQPEQVERGRAGETRNRVIGDRQVPRRAIERGGERRRRIHPFADDLVAAVRERAHHERRVLGRVLNQ